MHIHIAFTGNSIESTLNVIRAVAADKVYLMYGSLDADGGYRKRAEETRSAVEAMGGKCEIRMVDIMDFLSIVDEIYNVYEENSKGPGDTFSVDITRGTNLMAAAACCTAFFTGAQVYYSHDATKMKYSSLRDLLIEIPSPKIPNIQKMGDETIEILRYIEERSRANSPVINAEIGRRFDISTPTAKYHTDRLEEAGLIERLDPISKAKGGDGRAKPFQITREGRFVLRWR